MSDLDLARAGYEAYATSTGGKTFDGRLMPAWGDLPPRTVEAWLCAAITIKSHVTVAERTKR